MNKNESNIVILLTAAIKPNSFNTLALKDSEIRKKQYIAALNFYLKNTSCNIVFAENSGVSLEMEFEGYKNRLEFVTYTSLPDNPDKGKGAKELEIINQALTNSKFIAKSLAVVKITGRLKVLNINALYKDFMFFNLNNEKMLTCNIYKTTRMDSRCFFFTKDFWPYLEKYGKSINLKHSFEQALWDSGLAYMRDGCFYKQFKRPLRISGISGGFGISYDDSFLIALIKGIRHYFRAPYFYMKMNKLIS
ncbi:MAG: hypothetical protein ABIP68_07535 [Ferruginibacter sp.]